MIKVGIFGGAFDPVHTGHINLAKQAFSALTLNKMIIIPTGTSPHKENKGADFSHRANMCRLAFEGMKGFEVSEIENKKGKSYTINTLRSLKELYPKDTMFFLIIGGDMLFYFKKWYKYESILNECRVVAAAREENEYIDLLEYANEIGKVRVLNLPVTEISSTQVREELAQTRRSEYIPENVLDYILENNLYN